MVFSTEAQILWKGVWEKYRKELEKFAYTNPLFCQHISKMLSYVMRLSCVIHTLDFIYGYSSDLQVCSKSALERAIKVASYFLGQFRLLQISSIETKTSDPFLKNSYFDRTIQSFNLDSILIDIINFLKDNCADQDNTTQIRDIVQRFKGRKINNTNLTTSVVKELLDYLAQIGLGHFIENTTNFKLAMPTIQSINENNQGLNNQVNEELDNDFQIGDQVACISGENDGYVYTVKEVKPLEVIGEDGTLLSIDSIICLATNEQSPLKEQCNYHWAKIMELVEKLSSPDITKEDVIRLSLGTYSLYFRIVLHSFLGEEQKISIENLIN
jgi:hypothetical protein